MKKESLEFKVGIFVCLGIAALGMLVFKAGDFYIKPGYTIRILFNHVSGIDKGSPVRLAGVDVGEISKVTIIKNNEGTTQAELTVHIAQGVSIEEDAQVWVNSLGLLGEKYVEISPGSSGAKLLTEGSVLEARNVPGGGLEKLSEAGSKLIAKLDATVDSISKIVSDPEFQASVKNTFGKTEKTFTNAEVFSKNLIESTEDLKDAAKSARIILARIRDGEGTIGKLLKDDKMAKDLEAFAAEIKKNPWRLLKRD